MTQFKIPLLADFHFGASNHSKTRFESQMLFFEKQFFPWCLKNKVNDVLFLGDFTHNRNVIDLYILQELKSRFFRWFENNKIKLHCICGNHDTFYKSSLSHNFFVENVNEFSYTIPYYEETIIQLDKYTIGMIPWLVEPKDFIPPTGCDILCGHLEISNFPMMKNIMSHDGFIHEVFKDFKYVFSGHYHIKSHRNNIVYVGTQYQLTWNDYEEDKGFYVLSDNFKLNFVSNKVNPRFVKIYYDNDVISCSGLDETKEITKEEAVKIAKNNYVRVYVLNVNSQFTFDAFFNSLCHVSKDDYKIETVDSQRIIEDFNYTELEKTLDGDSNTLDISINYINGMTFESDIESNTLIEMSKQLYQEAINESIGADC